jgi:hypothetical protein
LADDREKNYTLQKKARFAQGGMKLSGGDKGKNLHNFGRLNQKEGFQFRRSATIARICLVQIIRGNIQACAL